MEVNYKVNIFCKGNEFKKLEIKPIHREQQDFYCIEDLIKK